MIFCECCSRQILPGKGTPDSFVTYAQYPDCSNDLNEYGLFPEEVSKEA